MLINLTDLKYPSQVLLASGRLSQHGTVGHLVVEKLGRQELTPDGTQYVLHLHVTAVFVIFNPFQDSVVHLLLVLHVQLVLFYKVDQLETVQLQKLFFLADLKKLDVSFRIWRHFAVNIVKFKGNMRRIFR